MSDGKRIASLADLMQYAEYLRACGHTAIYVWCSEPGVIRWSRTEPTDASRLCIVGPTGRLWCIVHGSEEHAE